MIIVDEQTRAVSKTVMSQLDEIWKQREEILAAFVAKYGIDDPANIEQVIQPTPIGSNRDGYVWYVRRRKKDEHI